MSSVKDKIDKSLEQSKGIDTLKELITGLASDVIIKMFLGEARCEPLIKEILLCLTYDEAKEIKQCIRDRIKEYESEKPKETAK